jgi:hypothetical protein
MLERMAAGSDPFGVESLTITPSEHIGVPSATRCRADRADARPHLGQLLDELVGAHAVSRRLADGRVQR